MFKNNSYILGFFGKKNTFSNLINKIFKKGFVAYLIEQLTGNSEFDFGKTGSWTIVGQDINLSAYGGSINLTNASFWVRQGSGGAPTDKVVAKVYSSHGGTLLATSDEVDCTGTSIAERVFTFAGEQITDTSVFIALERTGALNDTLRYRCHLNTGGGYGGGQFRYKDATTWYTNASYDARFKLNFTA